MTLSRALRILVAIALTAYLLYKSEPAAVARAAAAANPAWLAAAVALVIVDRALNAYRWLILLRAVAAGTRPAIAVVMRVFFVSSFVGNFLPSVGGDVYRAYQLSRLGVRGGEAAASVLMDRILGVMSMVLVAACALPLMDDFDVPGVRPSLVVVSLACLAAGVAVFSPRAAAIALSLVERVPSAEAQHVARGLMAAVRGYAGHAAALAFVLGLSVAVQLLRVTQAYCLGRALDVGLPVGIYFGFIPVITLVMQLPITVAGLGTTQYAFEWMFGRTGVAPATTFTLSVLFLALGTLGNLPGGLLYALGPRPEERGAGN